MTTWAQFRTDLETVVQSLVDESKCDVVWKDSGQPFATSKTLCRMSIPSASGGLAEKRITPIVGDQTKLAVTFYSNVKATVQFLFECVSQENVDTPLDIADSLAGALQFTNINEDTSFVTATPIVDANFVVDDRMMAAVQFEAQFNVLITSLNTTVDKIKEVDFGFDLADISSDLVAAETGPYPVIDPET